MKLCIGICATQSYQYALRTQATAILRCLASAGIDDADLIIATDEQGLPAAAMEMYENLGRIRPHFLKRPVEDGLQNYKPGAQSVIATLREACLSQARKLGATHFWSLDSDCIPPFNALRVSFNVLQMDAGWYSIAFCPYPSQGGGSLLGGYGSLTDQIFTTPPTDRQCPPELIRRWVECLDEYQANPHPATGERLKAVVEESKKFPMRANIFTLQGEGFSLKRCGWAEYAYPGIGLGAIMPTKWCGFGCTLLNSEAMNATDWLGYQGSGTEDLHAGWIRWYPRGLRIAWIGHCLVSHVIRQPFYRPDFTHAEFVRSLGREPFSAHPIGDHMEVPLKEFFGVLEKAGVPAKVADHALISRALLSSADPLDVAGLVQACGRCDDDILFDLAKQGKLKKEMRYQLVHAHHEIEGEMAGHVRQAIFPFEKEF